MAKIKSLIGALKVEMPYYADAMKGALTDHRDARRDATPDIEGQLTGGKEAKLRADMALRTGERVKRVVHRGKKGAQLVVDEIKAAKAAAAAEQAAMREKMAAYHADRTTEMAMRNGREASGWSPLYGGDTYDNRGVGGVEQMGARMVGEAADEATDASAESPVSEGEVAKKVGRKPRATRDERSVRPPVSRSGRF